MQSLSTSFPFDDVRTPWGRTLAEVEALFPADTWLKPQWDSRTQRAPCRSVLGLNATEIDISAPSRHKPVLSVRYELAPPPEHPDRIPFPPHYWLQPLSELMGPPARMSDPAEARITQPGDVVFTAHWNLFPIEVYLAIYGGLREGRGDGAAAAGLWLSWMDLEGMARPLCAAAQALADSLSAVATEVVQAEKFVVREELRPACIQRYDSFTGEKLPPDDNRRKAERALNYDGLCDTPAALSEQLEEREILLWAVPGSSAWAVSTKWDTTLATGDGPPAELTILHPAKAKGGIYLRVGGLPLYDVHGSPTLVRLSEALKKATGLEVTRYEAMDC